jgi:hypothetical protein
LARPAASRSGHCSGTNRPPSAGSAIRIIFRGLAHGEPRLALPALGGLFAPEQCPDLDAASLANAHLLTALQHLRWASIAGSLTLVDYRNMGPEELGSVYESLLELVPSIDLPARTFGFVGRTEEGTNGGAVAGNARRLTGSYYTPDSLVRQLIASALDPVIEQRLAANPANPTVALLTIRVIDPACGSGHILLAAARRLAEKLAQLRSMDSGQEGAIQPRDYRHALREVVARCLFGVDRNPMAIELARMALWLEGYEEGRPLGFLDHHLQVGDALLGLTDLHTLEKGIANSGDCKHWWQKGGEVVATYRLHNISRVKLENIFHRLFGAVQLDLTIEDRFGRPVKPKEWFLVPLQAIDEAVRRIRDGSVTTAVYDRQTARLV